MPLLVPRMTSAPEIPPMIITAPITILRIPRMARLWPCAAQFATLGLAILAAFFRPSQQGLANGPDAPITTSSPNGQIRFEVSLDRSGGLTHPRCRVLYKDGDFIKVPSLEVEFVDGTKFGADSVIDDSQTTLINTQYRQYPGKRSHVVDRCSETVISFSEKQLARRWQLVVRAYDDGVAFRYRFPNQDGRSSLEIAAERTAFSFPDGTTAFALPLNSFTTSYERRYEHTPITEIPKDWLLGLPMLVEIHGRAWAAVTEANLSDFAGMYLRDRRTIIRLWSVASRRCRKSRKSQCGRRCRTIPLGESC